MTRREGLTNQLREVLDLLDRAAEAGEHAPSNSEIADRCGIMHHSDASAFVKSLERKGLIKVERAGSSRKITMAHSGKVIVTAQARPPQIITADNGYRGPYPEHLRVERDACPRCAVRADIGCAHSAARLAMEFRL
jgi:SOS-response transcriptional repressor LexA